MKNSGKVCFATFNLNTDAWVPLRSPIACNYYALFNTGKMLLSSDTDKPDATITCNIGDNPNLEAPAPQRAPQRFSVDEIVLYAKAIDSPFVLRGVFVW